MIKVKRIESRGKAIERVEIRYHEPIEEIIRRMYVDERMSARRISKELNIAYQTVYDWLRKAGIHSHMLTSLLGESE